MGHATKLLTSRRFAPLFGAQLFGAFNDQFLKMAMITLVTWGGLSVFGMEPKLLVPVAGSIFTAPFFLFSAMAGQVSDKYDKAFVLLRVKQAEIGIMLLAAIGLYLQNPFILLTTIALMGAQSAFFSPTRNAVLPQWLTDKELITGNALMNGFVSVAVLSGQILGIMLIVIKGGPLIVAGILVSLAILGWLSIRKAPPAPPQNEHIKTDTPPLIKIRHQLTFLAILSGQIIILILLATKGNLIWGVATVVALGILRWLYKHQHPPKTAQDTSIRIEPWFAPEIWRTFTFAGKNPRVLRPMLGTAWYYWLSAGVLILMPAFIRDPLYYDRMVLIGIMALFTVGALAGAITCMIVTKGKDAVGISAVGALGIALCSADMYILFGDTSKLAYGSYVAAGVDGKAVLGTLKDFWSMPNSLRFMFGLFGAAFSASLFVIPLNALAQKRANPSHRARLLAAGALLLNAATTMSQLLVFAIGIMALPTRLSLLIIAVISGMIALYVFYRSIVLKKEAI